MFRVMSDRMHIVLIGYCYNSRYRFNDPNLRVRARTPQHSSIKFFDIPTHLVKDGTATKSEFYYTAWQAVVHRQHCGCGAGSCIHE